MPVDGLRNAVPSTPCRGIVVATAVVTATTRRWRFPGWLKSHSLIRRGFSLAAQHTWERGRVGTGCLSENGLLVLGAVDLACDQLLEIFEACKRGRTVAQSPSATCGLVKTRLPGG